MLIINSLGVVLMQYPITLAMNKLKIKNAFIVGSVQYYSMEVVQACTYFFTLLAILMLILFLYSSSSNEDKHPAP